MSTETNKSIVRNWVSEAWNKGNLSSAEELYPVTYAFNDPSSPEPVRGPEGIKGLLTLYRTAAPDLTMVIEDMIAEGDKVAWRWTVRGTQTGPLMHLPPSGRPFTITGTLISRFGEGQWLEDYSNFDFMGLLQQVGAIPSAS